MKFSTQYLRISVLFMLLAACLVLVPSRLMAQRLTSHRGTVKQSYNYWFYVPTAQPQNGSVTVPPVIVESDSLTEGDLQIAQSRKPLVIFLHGASLCGKDLSKVRRYGTIDALSKGLRLDAYVLAPQNPGGSWNPTKLNRIVDWATTNFAIDTTRIYVLGMSLGGYGTIDYAAHSPNRIAAAMALCGGSTGTNYAPLNDVPLCILHGTGDRAVAWQCSQAVVNGMCAAGDTTRLIYRLLPKRSHGDLARYFYLPAVYDWLFQHSLTDEGRPVNRNYNFGYEVTENVYSKLDKPSRPLIVENYTGGALKDSASKSRKGKGGKDNKSSNAKEDAAATTSGSTAGVHVVKQGDNLSKIAKRYGVTVNHLCEVNNIKRTSILQIGQKIKY